MHSRIYGIIELGNTPVAVPCVQGVAGGLSPHAIPGIVCGQKDSGLAAATGKHEAVVESEAVLTWTTVDPRALSASNNSSAYRSNSRRDHESDDRDRDDDRGRDDDHYATRRSGHHDEDEGDDNDGDRREADRGGNYSFSAHDRVILRDCMGDNYSNLPPGLAKRGSLPPGLERQLQRNGTLPPGLQKRIQPLPEECEVQLPRLPREWERVILGSQIILLDGKQTIRDILEIAGRD